MSKYFCMDIIDSPVDQPFTTGKDTNLEYIRVRFIKVGNPAGTMVLKVLNAAKTATIAASTAINCDFVTDANYVGTDDVANMSWIRFAFNGEALRDGTDYCARLECDATYIAGRDASNYIMAVLDYPKPTNDNGLTSIETTWGRNFAKYPTLVLQFFGRDYGEND